MSLPRITELPYWPDSAQLFDKLADRPWAVFLDSSRPSGRQGRFDIIAADPGVTLSTHGAITEVRTNTGAALSPRDPFALVAEQLGRPTATPGGLPFAGGAIGYFGYDLARRVEQLPSRAVDAERMPAMAVGIYDWALVVDHHAKCSWLASHCRDPRTDEAWAYLVDLLSVPAEPSARRPFRLRGALRSNMGREEYAEKFQRIKHYIREGDCYQVNLAQRFAATAEGDPWLAYQELRRINPAPFAAYLHTPSAHVLSASPERFLEVRDQCVVTKPIKGTRPRAPYPDADRQLAEALLTSTKDRAENVMIVDLLRNDLGKCCVPGSVRVPKLFALESFATVHHLVSTVTGELRPEVGPLELLRACFPGGSITGAPKLRAMEIIEELEPHRRGVYCGAIGYVGFDGAMDTNIAIRTMVFNDGVVRFWAGGGIVQDSVLEEEYQETFDKAAAMLRLLSATTSTGDVQDVGS